MAQILPIKFQEHLQVNKNLCIHRAIGLGAIVACVGCRVPCLRLLAWTDEAKAGLFRPIFIIMQTIVPVKTQIFLCRRPYRV